jgi:TnpA family transposase
MLRIALSISEGKIHSSAILRRLGTASRKSKLYQAFAELGRLVRTVFLLDFIHDAELRHTVTTATNTAETWNGFTKWIAFGGDGVIRQSSREEQRKFIRYNHIVANLIVFHNAVTMTKVLQQLIDEYPVTKEILARLSPCKIRHINRFGQIEMQFDRKPDPVVEDLRL